MESHSLFDGALRKDSIVVKFDGGCQLRESATYGFVIHEGDKIIEGCGRVPCEPEEATNNLAEHYALNMALTYLLEHGYVNCQVEVYGDSNLVINQVFGGWKIKKDHHDGGYAVYALSNIELARKFNDIRGFHIPREENEHADSLARLP